MSVGIPSGHVLGGFEIEGLLHTGGNGYVYRVKPADGRDRGFPLVMKVPAIGRGEPTLGVVSFEIEEAILPLIEGSCAPRVVAVGDDPLRPYMVMEEIRGESLAAVAKRAPLDPDEAARIGAAI